MNYSEMSDVEINISVARLLFPEKKVTASASRPPKAHIVGRSFGLWVDYCNSWADAGPIILENSIGLIAPFAGFEPEGFARWNAYDPMSQDRVFSHENPLRAAMIVFLMMQEAK